jgi:hypothetical protein
MILGKEDSEILHVRREEKCQEKVMYQKEKYFQIQYTVVLWWRSSSTALC